MALKSTEVRSDYRMAFYRILNTGDIKSGAPKLTTLTLQF
jgi:hypothetical protein